MLSWYATPSSIPFFLLRVTHSQVLLIVWAGASHLRRTLQLRDANESTYAEVCSSPHVWIFTGLQLAYCVVLVSACMVFAFLQRSIHSKLFWGELKWASLSVCTLNASLRSP